MPAWGKALPPQDIWKLVSYIQGLGGAVKPTDYHKGLQGDHDVTTIAPEAASLIGVFDQDLGGSAPSPPYTP
jgi:mono/diheme cytochrome c family protein